MHVSLCFIINIILEWGCLLHVDRYVLLQTGSKESHSADMTLLTPARMRAIFFRSISCFLRHAFHSCRYKSSPIEQILLFIFNANWILHLNGVHIGITYSSPSLWVRVWSMPTIKGTVLCKGALQIVFYQNTRKYLFETHVG